MHYRALGATGLHVFRSELRRLISRRGFPGDRRQGVHSSGPRGRWIWASTISTLRLIMAWAAPNMFLGRALQGVARDRYYLATKNWPI